MELTTSGYLYLNAELAAARFPNDAVLATIDDVELVLWPTSGSFAGGLILKQRNPLGDRCVLLSEILPPQTEPGMKQAVWSDSQCHLRVELSAPAQAVAANTFIEKENGRWVVYLEVGFWEATAGAPLKVTRSRIRDYPTRQDAEVAASWIRRSADRNVNRPVEGS